MRLMQGQTLHPVVRTIMQLPQFAVMQAQNPEVANMLLMEIQADPSPAKIQAAIGRVI